MHMMTYIKRYLTLLVLAFPAGAFSQNITTLDSLQWMLGNWQRESDKLIIQRLINRNDI